MELVMEKLFKPYFQPKRPTLKGFFFIRFELSYQMQFFYIQECVKRNWGRHTPKDCRLDPDCYLAMWHMIVCSTSELNWCHIHAVFMSHWPLKWTFSPSPFSLIGTLHRPNEMSDYVEWDLFWFVSYHPWFSRRVESASLFYTVFSLTTESSS